MLELVADVFDKEPITVVCSFSCLISDGGFDFDFHTLAALQSDDHEKV